MIEAILRHRPVAWTLLLLIAVLYAVLPIETAFAQTVPPAASVAFPIGVWIADIGGFLMLLVPAVIGWLLRHLPAQIVAVIKAMRADQLLQNAIAYGINAVEGAEAGKALNVKVGNAVVAAAGQYAVDHGAPNLIAWLGGENAIAEKIVARLQIEPASSVVATSGGPTLVAPGAASPAQ